jgi:actin-like ATPase involved in cell morphogenesis
MGYSLGVDLGNTYVAAAVSRGGEAEMATLGQGALVIPAVVFVGDDGTVVVGEPAVRRGLAEPDRVASGFKRRLGRPVHLGGRSFEPQRLLAELLRSVVTTVARDWGGELPERVMLARPATWDPGRRALFDQVPGLAGLPAGQTGTVTEPEAVLTHYAASRRLADGALVAVYDLGGGSFEVSVVRAGPGGVQLLGTPQGIDRLGGIDFDEALIDLVDHSLGGPLGRLDPSSLNSLRAMARLREQCVYAKEVLSHDDVVDIPVQLDRGDLDARVTREDLEHLLRPSIQATVPAVRAAIGSAGVFDGQLDSILLVGGSSRIPLVAQTLRQAFQCPVRANVNPDNAVALGAALAAAAVPPGRQLPGAGPAATGPWVGAGPAAAGPSIGTATGAGLAAGPAPGPPTGPRPANGPRNPTGPRPVPTPSATGSAPSPRPRPISAGDPAAPPRPGPPPPNPPVAAPPGRPAPGFPAAPPLLPTTGSAPSVPRPPTAMPPGQSSPRPAPPGPTAPRPTGPTPPPMPAPPSAPVAAPRPSPAPRPPSAPSSTPRPPAAPSAPPSSTPRPPAAPSAPPSPAPRPPSASPSPAPQPPSASPSPAPRPPSMPAPPTPAAPVPPAAPVSPAPPSAPVPAAARLVPPSPPAAVPSPPAVAPSPPAAVPSPPAVAPSPPAVALSAPTPPSAPAGGTATPLFMPSPPPGTALAVQSPRAAAMPAPLPATSPSGSKQAAPRRQKDRQAAVEVRRFATLLTLLLLLTVAGVVLFIVLLGIKITI